MNVYANPKTSLFEFKMFVNRLKCFLCKFNSVFGQLNDKRTNRDTTKRNIFEKNDDHKKVIETYTESRVTNR